MLAYGWTNSRTPVLRKPARSPNQSARSAYWLRGTCPERAPEKHARTEQLVERGVRFGARLAGRGEGDHKVANASLPRLQRIPPALAALVEVAGLAYG
jgi:hypothetical protein